MVSMISTNEIGERILTALLDTMGVGRAMVFVAGEKDEVLRAGVWRGDWREPMADTVVTKDHPLWEHLRQHRSVLSRRALEDDPESAEFFDRLGVELLVPILYGNDLLGAIAVGQKRTGDRLAGADRQLLQTLANQSAIAIENARAFDEIAKLNETLEARVETRTRELRETQDQLMQSEKLKSMGQLVAGVAHELNNPIGFVHSKIQLLDEYVGRLLEGPGDEAEAKQIRDTIAKLLLRSREGAQRVKQIVEDLRTFSRTDQAAIEEVDLHEELDRTLALMEPRFRHKIEVERCYGELPRVRCYPGQLNQVFLNLLMNAGDAMEGHGQVTVRTRPWVRGVRIDFEDSGPGITPEVLGRLFDPFFTTKEVGQGTGLGLSISHSIVERHGGRIYAASRPERGAIFSIEIPLDAPVSDE
jgi:signal transduction histidine kinase